MNTKVIALLMLVMLFASPALAAITVVWNSPNSGQTFNNLPSNISNVDLNFTVTDNNADVLDHNLNIIIYNGSTFAVDQNLALDVNVRDTTGTGVTCTAVTDTSLLDSYTCNYIWTLPANTAMGDGPYYIDANIVSVGPNESTQVDTNTTRGINISTRLATGETLRSLMAMVGVVLAALVLLGGLITGLAFKTDPAKTAIVTVMAAVAVAIGAQIIGVVLATV